MYVFEAVWFARKKNEGNRKLKLESLCLGYFGFYKNLKKKIKSVKQ